MSGKVRLPAVDVGDVITVITDATSRWTVHDGVAPPEVRAPFVSIFPLPYARQTPSLAAEDWGTVDAVFQLSCFGESIDQARWLAEQIILADWPVGWDFLDDQAAPVVDNAPAPSWQFVPLTFRYHG